MQVKKIKDRKISKREKSRCEKVATDLKKLKSDGYKVNEVLLDPSSFGAVLFWLPALIATVLCGSLLSDKFFASMEIMGTIIVAMIGLPVLFELARFVCFKVFGSSKHDMEFGFPLSPSHCHYSVSTAVMTKGQCVTIMVLPALITIIASIVASLFGAEPLCVLAVGLVCISFIDLYDFGLVFKLCANKADKFIFHPYNIGFLAISKDLQEDECDKIVEDFETHPVSAPQRHALLSDTTTAILNTVGTIVCVVILLIFGVLAMQSSESPSTETEPTAIVAESSVGD